VCFKSDVVCYYVLSLGSRVCDCVFYVGLFN
jgi:hypothetical protein